MAIELLREGGQAVDLAKNGEEAVRMVSEKAYATILLDTQMLVMDGVTATEKNIKLPKFVDLPILAMTTNTMDREREKTREAGMNAHIAKPVDP